MTISNTNVITADVNLAGEIGRAVLADLLPPRRPRISVRKVNALVRAPA